MGKTNGDKLIKLTDGKCMLSTDDNEDEKKDEIKDQKKNSFKKKQKKNQLGTPTLSMISEDVSLNIDDIDDEIKKKKELQGKKKQMAALRLKYSSRRIVLHGKRNSKKKMPKCAECNTYFHIQGSPINAYNGIGIVCDICGKNRNDNPEMLLEDHYYKCENCEGVDICSKCYKKEKRALNEKHKKGSKNKKKLVGI